MRAYGDVRREVVVWRKTDLAGAYEDEVDALRLGVLQTLGGVVSDNVKLWDSRVLGRNIVGTYWQAQCIQNLDEPRLPSLHVPPVLFPKTVLLRQPQSFCRSLLSWSGSGMSKQCVRRNDRLDQLLGPKNITDAPAGSVE